MINQQILKGESLSQVYYCLDFINELVKSGVFQVWLWAHNNAAIKYLVKKVIEAIEKNNNNPNDHPEKHFLPEKNNSKNFPLADAYNQVLRCLRFWSQTYLAKSLADESQ